MNLINPDNPLRGQAALSAILDDSEKKQKMCNSIALYLFKDYDKNDNTQLMIYETIFF